jgi:hypothetical protein
LTHPPPGCSSELGSFATHPGMPGWQPTPCRISALRKVDSSTCEPDNVAQSPVSTLQLPLSHAVQNTPRPAPCSFPALLNLVFSPTFRFPLPHHGPGSIPFITFVSIHFAVAQPIRAFTRFWSPSHPNLQIRIIPCL